MDIVKIDHNLQVETDLKESDLKFYDVRHTPFSLYGLYRAQEEPQFKRLPDAVGTNVNEGVAQLYLNTAGGRVRFATDSRYIAIKANMPSICLMPHMPLTGSAGFDLYLTDPVSGSERYVKTFNPPVDARTGYESIVYLPNRKMRCFTVHFPLYSPVTDLYVGLQQDAALEQGMAYRPMDPIVYYGSSITQGGCASRPGNAYQAVIAQRTNVDFLNLGFSGSGKGEDTIAEYMATLKMSAFVSDYDHNAPTLEHLKATHCRLYQTIRAAHPNIPYLMLSRPNYMCDSENGSDRREIILETYRFARAQGDRNVYWIDGESLFRGPYANLTMVDGVHPNDVGFALMADAIEYELRMAWTARYL